MNFKGDFQNGNSPYLFKANNSDDLAQTVLELLQNRSQWEALRQQGRHYVEQERNWLVSVARYEAVYQGILKT
ncbi:glycosyltransferase [methane-oxidizing endosymbiont of Gigantopelta aegis]|uniref:glycosyltransferase n=1 Tax=methane-oxidizing endosymbiont of Gigantopelta aegis TaxID=2794938 RepID=UPI0018DECDFE|nr:glycosyltransferase [methane-oxidizing endosymbiont of Gigantopelta aegis]